MSACVLAPYRQSRKAWMSVHGAIPRGAYVLHRCDVGNCVNVDHLFLGDASANAADMYLKGRAAARHQTPAAVANAAVRASLYYPDMALGTRKAA